jgi:diguanylate cyclase (GGDEF)-like protein
VDEEKIYTPYIYNILIFALLLTYASIGIALINTNLSLPYYVLSIPLFILITLYTNFPQSIALAINLLVAAFFVSQNIVLRCANCKTLNISILICAGVVIIASSISRYVAKIKEKKLKEMIQKCEEYRKERKRIEEKIKFYQKEVERVNLKFSRYRMLSLSIQQIGNILEPKELQKRLLATLRNWFPGSVVHFLPGDSSYDPFSSWVIRHKSPLLVSDINRDYRFTPPPGQIVNSILSAPVIVKNEIYGIIRIDAPERNFFDSEDLRLLNILSSAASIAFENAILFLQLKELSITDTLTGLYTQKFFLERLRDEVLRAGRYKYPLGVLLLDIDHFKSYNDTYGHLVGDEILRSVGVLLKNTANDVNIISRYGGEEFGIIVPNTDRISLREMAEILREKISTTTFNTSAGEIKLTVSIGIAVFPEEATSPSQIIRVADQRLYWAKSKGRNRVGW